MYGTVFLKEAPMPARKSTVRKFSSLMSEPLLRAVQEQAVRNGQTMRFVLECAVKHYLEVVTPSGEVVNPRAAALLKASIARNDDLLKRLAKAK